MTASCDDLIERAYAYERRPKDRYFAAEPTETEEWYEVIHWHFENILFPEIQRQGDLFVEYWPVRFVSEREHTLRQGITTSKLYNYEYGSHGTGYLCVTNRHIHLVVLKELTDKFSIHKPSLSGLLLDALFLKRITQLRPFQDDYTWTLSPADIRSVSIYQGRSGRERIKMETAAGMWEIYTHFHRHDEKIRRGLECLRNGAFGKLRPKFHMTRKPSILSDAELMRYQTRTKLSVVASPETLDSVRAEQGTRMLDLHYLASQVAERGSAEVEFDLTHAMAAHPNDEGMKELYHVLKSVRHLLDKCTGQAEILDNLQIRIDRIPELADIYEHSVRRMTRPYFKSWHALPDMPVSALIRNIEAGEIHKPEYYDSKLSFCWGPDGNSLVTGGNDGMIRIWNLATGVVQEEFQAFEKGENHYSHTIVKCVLNPDQSTLVTVSLSQGLKAWNTDNWKLRFHVNTGRMIQYCAFDLGGKYIGYSIYSSNMIILLDASTGRSLLHSINYELLKHLEDDSIQSFKLAPSGNWVLVHVIEEEWEIQRFVAVDIDSGAELFAFKEFDCHSFDISPCGRYILTHRGPRADLNVWDVVQGTYTHEIERSSHGPYRFNPSGKYVVSGFDDGRLVVYNLQSGKEVYTLTGHLAAIKDCQFSTDGRFLLSMDERNSIKLWDLTKASLASVPKYFLPGWSRSDSRRGRLCTSCEINPLDESVMVGNSPRDHDAAILDSSSGKISEHHVVQTMVSLDLSKAKLNQIHYFGIDCFAVSANGKLVLLANHTTWALFDTQSFSVVLHSDEFLPKNEAILDMSMRYLFDGFPRSCALSFNNRWVAVGFEAKLMIWDLGSAIEESSSFDHNPISSQDATDEFDTRRSFTTRQIKIVDTEAPVRSIAFDPNSQWLVYTTGSIMGEPEVKMYLLDTGIIQTFDNPVVASRRWPEGKPALTTWGPALDCDVTPDGSRIILAHADDGTISIWNADTLTLVHSWQAHASLQNIDDSIACKSMPNSESVLTVASDGAVHLWEIQSGKCIASYYTDGKLSDCAVFPDGKRIVAVGEAGVHWLKLKMPAIS